ncbi:MAG: hypothetical protein XE08_0213 [Parcubacteria bacterium 32_520]|nr:MAG: hypothetical protein XE08_0213 [Parcubacteria bacterium 32_520]
MKKRFNMLVDEKVIDKLEKLSQVTYRSRSNVIVYLINKEYDALFKE